MSTTERAPWLKDLLWVLVLVGAVAIGLRLWFGLGATTNLDDAVPWGLWKILNMVAGVALATGGFTVGLLVYVLGVERLRPLVRPAILIAFLGYGSSVFALALDIGLPHRIWHPFVMWNPHSFLFEVAMCVAAYFALTVVELAPVLLERFPRWTRVVAAMHRAAPGLVILGITLSSLHHTSLGSLFLVTPQRLHPLWYTGWLPVLFITSAMGAGMMVTVLVALAWRWLHDPHAPGPPSASGVPAGADPDLLGRLRLLASVAAGILAFFLVLKVADLVRTGAWRSLLAGSWESGLYGAELLLTSVIPVIVMLVPGWRRRAAGIAVAALAASAGMVLNRLDVGVFGYIRDAGELYFPSPIEWAVCLGVIAAAGLVLLAVGEAFPVFDAGWRQRSAGRRRFRSSFDPLSGVWRATLGDRFGRVSLVGVVVVPLVLTVMMPDASSDGAGLVTPVSPPIAADEQRAVLRIDGDRDETFPVAFPHLEHRERLGGDSSCPRCHHLAWPRDHATPCSRCHRAMHTGTDLFEHDAHLEAVARAERLRGAVPGNRSCPICHLPGRPESARDVRPCLDCHRQDMHPSPSFGEPDDLRLAPSYRLAFHAHCVPCHQREAALRERPELAECRSCHPGVRGTGPGPRRPSTLEPTDPLLRSRCAEPDRGAVTGATPWYPGAR